MTELLTQPLEDKFHSIRRLIGREHTLGAVGNQLYHLASALNPPVTGAMQITCADESEHECTSAFQKKFVQYHLPPLKFAQPSPFRIANLGGRYEWDAIRIAEQHYATEASCQGWKLLLVKINAHVGIDEHGGSGQFGTLRRYDQDSPCCGALNALLAGSFNPHLQKMRELFLSENNDRLATLVDDSRTDVSHRALYAAAVSTRLQARQVCLDIQDYRPVSATVYVIFPCVTINRPDRDTEIVCGYYMADAREGSPQVDYTGLGDDPAGYRLEFRQEKWHLDDENFSQKRTARDHRQLALDRWRKKAADKPIAIQNEQYNRLKADMAANKYHHPDHARLLLRPLLAILGEVAPIPAAILLFAHGAVAIHHAMRVHRMAERLEGNDHARDILVEVESRIDHLPPKQAQALIEVLMQHYT